MKPPVIARIFQRAAASASPQHRGIGSDPELELEQPPSGTSDRIPDLNSGKQATSHGCLHEQMCGQRWIRRS
jgi:hypothetical protein